jgi:CheY-like chemotaxis protein
VEKKRKSLRVIMADDDEDDFVLMRDAFKSVGSSIPLEWVKDGEELLALLGRLGSKSVSSCAETRRLVILDLNMPKIDGREALKRIKADPRLCGTPVVVMTDSQAESDVLQCYELGACSFIRKPSGSERRIEIARILKRYWGSLVELPVPGGALCLEE